MPATDSPAVVDHIVVTADELVTALEASERTREQRTVLRVTPPFSGRMRARLHVATSADPDPGPVVVSPWVLVDDDCPPPPTPDETEDRLRSDPDSEYTVDRHREAHERAVRRWRDRVVDHVRDRVSLSQLDGEVTVSLLAADE